MDAKITDLQPICIPVKKACELMQCSSNTFRQFAAKNNVPIFYPLGRIPYVRYETLQETIKRLERKE
jgi:hypothetical protein